MYITPLESLASEAEEIQEIIEQPIPDDGKSNAAKNKEEMKFYSKPRIENK